jgi:hypothetical protein
MTLRIAALLSLTFAVPVTAQTLPVFDESLGYSIHGTVDDGLLLQNGANVFYCEIDEDDDYRYYFMTECKPILTPGQVRDIAAAEAAASGDEEALLAALEKLPKATFIPMVEQTMREMGCQLDFQTDEAAFLGGLARNVAREMGYDRPLSPDAIEEISDITEEAGDMMLDQGRITLDRDAGIVRLVDCP